MVNTNYSRSSIWKWIGFISSLFTAMQSGIFLSFAVYAVQLKEKFGLNLTKVELVGSFSVAGLSCILLGHVLIKRCGYVFSYFSSWGLVTSSGVLLWMSTNYIEFFNAHILLLCVFQLVNSMGAAMVELCCISIGMLQFDERHIGKVTGVYLGVVSLGKVYYAVSYSILFQDSEHLGLFFLWVPIGLTITLVLCVVFHRPSTKRDGGDAEKTEKSVGYQSLDKADQTYSRKNILTSKFFHAFFWSNIFFTSCGFSFMNNITAIANAAGLEHQEHIIYAVTGGTVLARIGFGVLLDFFLSKLYKMGLLVLCYTTFAGAMLIGLLVLNSVTIYVMTVLASIGMGAGFSLTIGILSAVFGRENYTLLIGLQELGIFIFTTVVSLAIGTIYDHEFDKSSVSTAFCNDCFYWTFVILLCGGILNLVISPITLLFWKREFKDVE